MPPRIQLPKQLPDPLTRSTLSHLAVVKHVLTVIALLFVYICECRYLRPHLTTFAVASAGALDRTSQFCVLHSRQYPALHFCEKVLPPRLPWWDSSLQFYWLPKWPRRISQSDSNLNWGMLDIAGQPHAILHFCYRYNYRNISLLLLPA